MKNMKLFLAGMLLSLFAISAFAQQDSLPMDQAISSSMSTLLMRLPEQTKVAILNFTAPNAAVSDYIIEELIAFIVNNSTHTVVDRQNLETLQREMNFQLSGEVDDTTAQSIGKKVGANTIVSGSLTPLGKGYRLRLRAINVETAEVQAQQMVNVRNDSSLTALIGFSTGRKLGAGFLNILGGAGSYSMGDWRGGVIVSAGYVAAVGLILWDVIGMDYDDPMSGVPGAIGIGIVAGAIVYGFIRPFTYNTHGGFRVSILSDKTSGNTVRVSYTWRF